MSEGHAETLEVVTARMRAYRFVFASPAGHAVLLDLVSFCRGAETCAVPGNHDKTFLLEGRREVWLRIQQNLNLTDRQLFRLYCGLDYQPGEDDDGSEPATAATAAAAK